MRIIRLTGLFLVVAFWIGVAGADDFVEITSDRVNGDLAVSNRSAEPESAVTRLKSTYRGIQVSKDGSRIRKVYGRPMTEGSTPDSAAANWLDRHADVLGANKSQLSRRTSRRVGDRFTVIHYEQSIDGLPVDRSDARVLVLNGMPNRVVMVNADLAALPKDGFLPDLYSADQVFGIAQGLPEYAHLSQWSDPELVIYFDHDRSLRAWKFQGADPDRFPSEYTFLVDAATGVVVDVRSIEQETKIRGSVTGQATPGLLPDVSYNPTTKLPIHGACVEARTDPYAPTVAEACANSNGEYLLGPVPIGVPLTLESSLEGPWANVHGYKSDYIINPDLPPTTNDDVIAPAFSDLKMNTTPTENFVAQVNSFRYMNLAHDVFKTHQPSFDGIDVSLRAEVMYPDHPYDPHCNAAFVPGSSLGCLDPLFAETCCSEQEQQRETCLLFLPAGGGCANTAYSSVVVHEYAHFIHYQIKGSQEANAFGEGLADAFAILTLDDPVIARDLRGAGVHGRDVTGYPKYECDSPSPHECGRVLGGIWWEIKANLGSPFFPSAGLVPTRQLYTDWLHIAQRPADATQSADPATALEVLCVDDDDGLLRTLTPHWSEICDAFDDHGITCADENGCPIDDCNNNGVNDCDDIGESTSTDRNGNSIPDECEA